MLRVALVTSLALFASAPALAQTAPQGATAQPASDAQPLDRALDRLTTVLAGRATPDTVFSPEFLAAVPVAQVVGLGMELIRQNGDVVNAAVTERNATGPSTAVIRFERGQAQISVSVNTQGAINFLRIDDVGVANDSMTQLTADIAALPGVTGWGLYRIAADGTATQYAGAGDAASLAIGSTFKLAILGALDAEIRAGRMRWTDVIALDRRSVPSGQLQNWPLNAPITLHSAAALMISISDNTATDLLLHHVGRERVEAFARAHGGLSGERAFPLLSTIEGTVLKNPALGAVRERWLTGNEAERRAALTMDPAIFRPANVDYTAFAGRPADIERIEWFASADSIAQLLGWFAISASDDARAILAINPGLPPGVAGRWAYVGFKGGSEPGVLSLNAVLRGSDGAWQVMSMTWNNSAAPVDEAIMITMASRAATLMRAP